jgi:nitroreductase
MKTSSETAYPVTDLIQKRRSVRAFLDKPVEAEKIYSLFEATRWAPSSSNEQPWIYVYATKDQPLWNDLFDALNDGNKIWAKDAPLFILGLARKTFVRNARENTYALYDLGAANAFLALQAVDLGLQVRQMAGFNATNIITSLKIPGTYEVGVMIAVGYPGDIATLPEQLQSRERAPRERYVQEVFVMNKPFD